MILIALFVFVGGTLWTVMFSFTSIKILPLFTPGEWWDKFNGFANYTRLFNTSRWMDCPAITKIGTEAWKLQCSGSLPNVFTYAILYLIIVMILGFLIAVLMDQKIRAEGVFRTIYLYPFALSFIVTGHVWAWIFSPEYGLQKAVRAWGWESFSFGWIADQKMVMYAIVIAGIWQGTGFVMALMLAGLRGIDEEIWKAAKIDGIPTWRTYLQIVLPMMKAVLVTTFVFVASGAIRIYDLGSCDYRWWPRRVIRCAVTLHLSTFHGQLGPVTCRFNRVARDHGHRFDPLDQNGIWQEGTVI